MITIFKQSNTFKKAIKVNFELFENLKNRQKFHFLAFYLT
jgi:hypothetical protein